MFRDFISASALILAAVLVIATSQFARAQTGDVTNGETDPVKLFERGQDAHAKNDYKKAIELYEAAIKLRPEFPEAEFQRAMALLALDQKHEAIEGFNRAVTQRPDWAMAYSTFGKFLGGFARDPAAAEPILRKAIELDPKDESALTELADIRVHANDAAEALKLVRAATSLPTAKIAAWRERAYIEATTGDKTSALATLDHALTLAPDDRGARYDRAKLRLETNDREGATTDLHALEQSNGGHTLAEALDYARLYDRAGKREDALRVLDSLPETDRSAPEAVSLRAEIAGDEGTTAAERAALETLLKGDPRNANLLSRLGYAYRLVDPLKSADYYYQALQLDPKSSNYAVGYAAALVQARKFAEAEVVLKRVLASAPEDYTAHANLAVALYKMKRFAEAIPECVWLANKRPEVAATYFFLATAHDNLGEYQDALDAYQEFLERADAIKDKLEIEKVNLRLPSLRTQIQRGQGVKRRTPNNFLLF